MSAAHRVLIEKYRLYLADEGYAPKVIDEDSEEDLRFAVKYEGMTYVVLTFKEDPEFVQIVLPNFYSLDDIDEKKAALFAFGEAAKRCKGAKVYPNSDFDNAMAAVEFLDQGDSVNQQMLLRYFKMLQNAAKVFASVVAEKK